MRYWTEHSTNVWEVGNLYNFSKKTQKMSLEGRKTVVGSEETTASEGNGLKQRPNIFCLPSKTCIFLRNPFSGSTMKARSYYLFVACSILLLPAGKKKIFVWESTSYWCVPVSLQGLQPFHISGRFHPRRTWFNSDVDIGVLGVEFNVGGLECKYQNASKINDGKSVKTRTLTLMDRSS